MRGLVLLIVWGGIFLYSCDLENSGENTKKDPPTDSTVIVNSIQAGDKVISVSVSASPGVIVTVSAYEDPEFSKPGGRTEQTATGNIDEIKVEGLINDKNYYVQIQGEIPDSAVKDWTQDLSDFVTPLSIKAYIDDVVPRSEQVTATVFLMNVERVFVEISSQEDFSTVVDTTTLTMPGNPQDITLFGLSNEETYYIRVQGLDPAGSTGPWVPYSTPLIPAEEGKQYIHRFSELAKIGVDTENYPLDWSYELKRGLDFLDADNNGVLDDPYDSDAEALNGNWTPLTAAGAGGFTGIFDGGGFEINGMTINSSVTDNPVGLFGLLSEEAVLRNAGLVNADISSQSIAGTGGLAGKTASNTSITNSYVFGEINSTEGTAGGVVGFLGGSIANSYSHAAIGGGSNLGGLAGVTSSTADITNSYAAGDVSGNSNIKGGLVGNHEGSIKNSYAAGDVSSTDSDLLGGLVGFGLAGSITNSFAAGNVLGIGSGIGGLAGMSLGVIVNSYDYENQTITGGGRHSETASLNDLKNKDWYTRQTDLLSDPGKPVYGLNWDEGTPGNAQWHINGLVNGNPPYLPRVNRIEETDDLPAAQVPGQPDTLIP